MTHWVGPQHIFRSRGLHYNSPQRSHKKKANPSPYPRKNTNGEHVQGLTRQRENHDINLICSQKSMLLGKIRGHDLIFIASCSPGVSTRTGILA